MFYSSVYRLFSTWCFILVSKLNAKKKTMICESVRADYEFVGNVNVNVTVSKTEGNITVYTLRGRIGKPSPWTVFFLLQVRGRCPDILSYPSDFPTSAYCACAHQYCILFLTLNNNI